MYQAESRLAGLGPRGPPPEVRPSEAGADHGPEDAQRHLLNGIPPPRSRTCFCASAITAAGREGRARPVGQAFAEESVVSGRPPALTGDARRPCVAHSPAGTGRAALWAPARTGPTRWSCICDLSWTESGGRVWCGACGPTRARSHNCEGGGGCRGNLPRRRALAPACRTAAHVTVAPAVRRRCPGIRVRAAQVMRLNTQRRWAPATAPQKAHPLLPAGGRQRHAACFPAAMCAAPPAPPLGRRPEGPPPSPASRDCLTAAQAGMPPSRGDGAAFAADRSLAPAAHRDCCPSNRALLPIETQEWSRSVDCHHWRRIHCARWSTRSARCRPLHQPAMLSLDHSRDDSRGAVS